MVVGRELRIRLGVKEGEHSGRQGPAPAKTQKEEVAGGLRQGCMVWSSLANKWGLCDARK